MRIALAQINAVVGDIEGNERLILDAVDGARDAGADVTLLPEMAITGYPPEDLLHRDHFVQDAAESLARIARLTTDPVLLGFVDRVDDTLYNACAVCGGGEVRAVYHKQRLPNYGVFDERRYFTAGDGPVLFELGGMMLGVTVCEDVWEPEIAAQITEAGAGMLLNISASPFHAGKGEERESMLRQRAKDNRVWLAYCNLVGAQDELVFDGRSVVISPEGEVVARAASFEPDLLVFDVAAGAHTGRVARAPEGSEAIYSALVLGLRDYVRKNGFTDVVLGLSGGIDSALTAVVAADALGPGRVHGVMMPGPYSSAGSVDDALALAGNLGIDVRRIAIDGPFEAFRSALEASFEGCEPDVAEENLQARVRGTLLMALSNKFGWLTLATGNKSELSVGYSTLYGDMVGGFAPLKDVFKTRVYELARWRNGRDGADVIPRATIDKPPSAELRPGQLDADSLPPYGSLDAILEHYVEQDESIDGIVAAGHDRVTVERVTRMVDRAEYKRRQGPLGIKITPKAFGKDRRMPITNIYRG